MVLSHVAETQINDDYFRHSLCEKANSISSIEAQRIINSFSYFSNGILCENFHGAPLFVVENMCLSTLVAGYM